jgi:hypothetical protein
MLTNLLMEAYLAKNELEDMSGSTLVVEVWG